MIGERVKLLRKHFNLTQQEFSERVGIKRNTIAKYETGRGVPTTSVITLIVREFKVSEEWLRTGEGEMFIQQSKEDEIKTAVESLLSGESSSFKRRLIQVLAELDERQWIVLEDKLKQIVLDKSSTATVEPLPSRPEEPHKITVEEAEAEYIKAMSERAQRQRLTASSTTADDTKKIG